VTKTRIATISVYGATAAHVRRLAAMVPAMTVNRIGARALSLGLALVERELLEAARATVAAADELEGV
jgi:hypothetical protein